MGEEVTEKNQESEAVQEWIIKRPPRAKLSPEEARKRMEEFPKRREAFVAAIRGGGAKGMSSLNIELTPEMDHRLQERAQRQGVAVADLVRSALEALVEPEGSASTEAPSGAADRPIWEKLAAIANEVPDEAMENLPTDLAEQHDHYIYGTPKKC